MSESLIVIRGPIGVGKSSLARNIREQMPERVSYVETDAIKRMLDPSASSEWRRNIAHDSAAFIIEQILNVPRSGVIEMHTKYPSEIERLGTIAQRAGATLQNVLLLAPLEVCKERAAERDVPDINYAIDDSMITNYYCNLEPLPGDMVFDTTQQTTKSIADAVINRTFN